MNSQARPSLDEITGVGEEIYFKNKGTLEKEHNGEFVVISIENGELFIDKDKTTAIQKAEVKYPNTLFFITQIGTLKEKNYTNVISSDGLSFSKKQNIY